MPKLNLRTAQRIKIAGVEALKIKGPGFSWERSYFNPASLFAANEQGVWYDPSDLTTMFQDNLGATPVTAAGQTVGLLLDKSRGLTLGSEMVINGTFDVDTSGWTAVATTLFSINGQLSFSSTQVTSSEARQTLTVMPGRSYEVRGNLISGTGRFRVSDGGVNNNHLIANSPITGPISIKRVFTPTTTTVVVRMMVENANATTVWDNISVRELPGNHATQGTLAARPFLRQTAGGLYYLEFDGTDDFLVTKTITPGIDKAQVFAGVRKLSDAAQSILYETSSNASTNNGALSGAAPWTAPDSYLTLIRGTTFTQVAAPGFSAPTTNIFASLGDISASPFLRLRINGVQQGQSLSSVGTGNFLAYPLYIGRRDGTTLPFNGHIYSLIVRFGANLDTPTIQQTEAWVAGKTGVTI